MDYGIKVSETGYDVKTVGDINLILKTNSNLLKVFASGSTTFSGTSWLSITHNLGYVPQFLVYLENITTAGRMQLGTGIITRGLAKADTTKIWYKCKTSGPFAVYYYIFYEQA